MATYVSFGQVPSATGTRTKVRCSALTQDTALTITHGGPAAVPDRVHMEVYTAPGDASVVGFTRTTSSDTTTVAGITFTCADDAGGNAVLTDAVVDLYFEWDGVKAGGIG